MKPKDLKPGDVVLHEEDGHVTVALWINPEQARTINPTNPNICICIKSSKHEPGQVLHAQDDDEFQKLDYDIFYKDKVIASNYEIKGS